MAVYGIRPWDLIDFRASELAAIESDLARRKLSSGSGE